jgi:flagellar L-ring protein precursor FlgH
MKTFRSTLTLLLGVAALAGCESMQRIPPVDVLQPTHAQPAPLPAQPPVTGSIFQAARYRPLVEDHRARLVGDTITVQISEKISATSKATSTVDKSGGMDASVSAFPGIKANSFAGGRASLGTSSSNTFEGKGVTESSNDFSGVITATVVNVLPNGHLVIAGEKQIGVNANVDVLRFSGTVDPRSIAPGNAVLSTQIANVRIEQRGKGQQAEAQSMAWLARFFLTLLPI